MRKSLIETPPLDDLPDGFAAALGEAEVEEPPRDLHVTNDVVDRDALGRVLVDVLEGAGDEPSGGRLHRRRLADGDASDADADDGRFGERRTASCGVIHHPLELLRGPVALFLEVGTDAGEPRLGVFADEPVVVHADDRQAVRDGQAGDPRRLQNLVRADVGGGEDGGGRREVLHP